MVAVDAPMALAMSSAVSSCVFCYSGILTVMMNL